MEFHTVPLLLTCGPAVLSTFAFTKVIRQHQVAQLRVTPLWLVGFAWLLTVYAAYLYLHYTIAPTPLPPWQDPENLGLASLFLFAPVGLITTIVAAMAGAAKSIVLPMVVAMVILLLVGIMAGISV